MANKFTNIDLDFKEGDKEMYHVDITDSAGAAADLSAYTIDFDVTDQNPDTAAILTKSLTDSQGRNNFAGGLLEIILTATETTALPNKSFYRLIAAHTTDAEDIITLMQGTLTKTIKLL